MVSILLYLLFAFTLIWILAVILSRKLSALSRIKYFFNRDELSRLHTPANVPRRTLKTKNVEPSRPTIFAFFHPYCHAGGGGERVLWMAIKALQDHYKGHERLYHIVVYTGDTDRSSRDFYAIAKDRFNISLDQSIQFLYLERRWLVEDQSYPYVTLLLQSLGGMLLGLEAFSIVVPDIFIDTMGYSFSYPLFKYLGCAKVVAYVHYPTISQDMLQLVNQRTASYNNNEIIARSPFLSKLKSFYYGYFAELYGFVGRCADVIMANSSWTKMHLDEVWKVPDLISVVYPPCDTKTFEAFPFEGREDFILSLGQFRPEKNHKLQLESLAKYFELPGANPDVKMLIVGGCRNKEDLDRVEYLNRYHEQLGLKGKVKFLVNMPFPELKKVLSKAKVGIHTMWNEHFGIGVVELMAAGCITVAHNSGGPKMDILKDYNGTATGFLASTPTEYASKYLEIFKMAPSNCLSIQTAARASVSQRFSDELFKNSFISSLEKILQEFEIY